MQPLKTLVRRAGLTLCVAALSGHATAGVQTFIRTHTDAFGPEDIEWGLGNGNFPVVNLSVPTFNAIAEGLPAGGTLKRVKIKASGSGLQTIAYENTSNAPEDLSIDTQLTITLLSPNQIDPPVADILLTPQDLFFVSQIPSFDGTPDNRGASGASLPPDLFTAPPIELTITAPGDVAKFLDGAGAGVDDLVFPATADGTATIQASTEVEVDIDSDAQVAIEVEYTYEVDVADSPCVERNRRNCGSLLLYPEFDNRPGILTLMTVTNACCDFPAPGASVEFRFINRTNCLKTDQTVPMTPCDTFSFLTTSVNSGGPNARGYAYAYAKTAQPSQGNPSGTPIVLNQLIGQQLILNGISAVNYSMNAVSFKGIGAEGSFNDHDQDGIRDLNGTIAGADAEYEEAPDEILIPRFLGQSDAGPARLYDSEIILVNLSGGSAFTTILDIAVFNDNEELISDFYEFYCWDKPKLRDFAGGTLESYLDLLPSNDPDEIVGASTKEAGWIRINGLVANSSGPEAIDDPAVYAVLVECTNNLCAADLPWELCSQTNGDLLSNNIFGDGPDFVQGDGE